MTVNNGRVSVCMRLWLQTLHPFTHHHSLFELRSLLRALEGETQTKGSNFNTKKRKSLPQTSLEEERILSLRLLSKRERESLQWEISDRSRKMLVDFPNLAILLRSRLPLRLSSRNPSPALLFLYCCCCCCCCCWRRRSPFLCMCAYVCKR